MSKGLMQWPGVRPGPGAEGHRPGVCRWWVGAGCGEGGVAALTLHFRLLVPIRDVEIPCLVHPLLPPWLSGLKVA